MISRLAVLLCAVTLMAPAWADNKPAKKAAPNFRKFYLSENENHAKRLQEDPERFEEAVKKRQTRLVELRIYPRQAFQLGDISLPFAEVFNHVPKQEPKKISALAWFPFKTIVTRKTREPNPDLFFVRLNEVLQKPTNELLSEEGPVLLKLEKPVTKEALEELKP